MLINFVLLIIKIDDTFINFKRCQGPHDYSFVDFEYYLFIPNEYFIKTLINDKNNHDNIKIILKKFPLSILLFYLYKYEIISQDTLKLFSYNKIHKEDIIIFYCLNYFYLDNKFYELKKLLKFIDRTYLINKVISIFERDVSILNYVINNLVNGQLVNSIFTNFRIATLLSLTNIKKYNSKIFNPNTCYLKYDKNKDTEKIINTIFNDEGLQKFYDQYLLKKYKYFPYNLYFNGYNIDPNINKNDLEIINLKKKTDVKNKNNNKSISKILNDIKMLIELEKGNIIDIKVPQYVNKNFENVKKIQYIQNEIKKFIDKRYTKRYIPGYFHYDYNYIYEDEFNKNFDKLYDYFYKNPENSHFLENYMVMEKRNY